MIALPLPMFRLLITSLVAITLTVVLGDYVLAVMRVPTPAGVAGLAHVALGGLIGLLVQPSPGDQKGAAPAATAVVVTGKDGAV